MKNQLHICSESKEFALNKVDEVISDKNDFRNGGLWTSTFTPGIGSHWMLGAKFPKEYAQFYNGYLFEVEKGAKIYEVNSMEAENYYKEFYKSNCENVALDFDALHLDYSYIEDLKRKYKHSIFLSWSTESTWWFNVKCLSLKELINGDKIYKMIHR